MKFVTASVACCLLTLLTILPPSVTSNGARCATESCVLLRQCPPLLRLLQSRSLQQRRSVTKAICGYQGRNAKVCCPEPHAGNTITTTEKLLVTTTQEIVLEPVVIITQPTTERTNSHMFSWLREKIINIFKEPSGITENPNQASERPAETSTRPPVTSEILNVISEALNRTTVSATDSSSGTEGVAGMESQPDLLPSQCGFQRTTHRIYGRTDAEFGRQPWIAAIMYTEGRRPPTVQCSGALISNRYVLTAAHCLDTRETQRRKLSSVVLGEWRVSTDPDCAHGQCAHPVLKFGVEEVIIHPQYSKKLQYSDDIALLRLNRTVPFSEFIQPVCLPPLHLSPAEVGIGAPVTVSGWGVTETRSSSDVLSTVTLNIANPFICRRLFPQYFDINGGQICIGGTEGEDSCKGDSGSPVIKTTRSGSSSYLLGLTSFGSKVCGQQDYPAVYTSVSHYSSWIRRTIRA